MTTMSSPTPEPFVIKAGQKFKGTSGNWTYMIASAKGDQLTYRLLSHQGEPFGMEYPISRTAVDYDVSRANVFPAEEESNG